jgi:TP901 family phage tail tape measure protein
VVVEVAVDVGTAIAYLDLDTSRFTNGLSEAQSSLSAFTDSSLSVSDRLDALGSAMTSTGSTLTKTVTTPLVALGTAAVATASNFDTGMSKVQAISGATSDEVQELRDKAIEMGAKTKFSASEAADAFTYMAMAGWDTADMLDGIEGIMSLAAADGLDLATTSDIVTDALTAFGLSASDSSHFADVLAKASSSANTNVSMLGESFKYVAPVAGALGMSVEDTAVALGLMANSGIKSSQAGTTLRTSLTRLVEPTDDMVNTMIDLGLATATYTNTIDSEKLSKAQTKVENKTLALEKAQNKYTQAVEKYGVNSTQAQNAAISLQQAQNNLADAQENLTKVQEGSNEMTGLNNTLMTNSDGTMRSLNDIIVTLRETFSGLTEEQQAQAAATLFGKESMSGMLAIINASDDNFNSLTEAIASCNGTAQDMSETMQDNLSGSITLLKSALESLAIKVGEALIPAIKSITEFITKIVEKLNTMSDAEVQQVVKIAAIVAAIGPLLIIVGKVISFISNIISAVSNLGSVVTTIIGLAKNVVSVGTTIVSGVTKLISFFGSLVGVLASVSPVVYIIIAAVAALIAIGVALYKNWDTVKEYASIIWEGIKNIVSSAGEAIKNAMQALMDWFSTTWQNIKDYIIQPVKDAFSEIGQKASEFWQSVLDFIAKVKEKLTAFFTEVGNAISDFVKKAVEGITNWIDTTKQKIQQFVTEFLNTIKDWVSKWWEAIKTACSNIINTIINWVSNMISQATQLGTQFLNTISNFFTQVVNFITNAVSSILNTVISWVSNMVQQAVSVGTQFLSTISNYFNQLVSVIQNIISTILSHIVTWVSNMIQQAVNLGTKFYSTIKQYMENVIAFIKSFVSNVLSMIKSWVSSMIQQVVEFGQKFVSTVKEALSNVIAEFKERFNEIVQTVVDFIPKMLQAGKDLMNSLWDGLKSVWEDISDWFSGVLDKVKNFVSNIFSAKNEAEEADGSHANGLDYVPYNGYIAKLHQGERVLTRAEAKAYNSGNTGSGSTFNFYSNESIDEYQAARLLKQTIKEIELGF